jgi:hypothetical protein
VPENLGQLLRRTLQSAPLGVKRLVGAQDAGTQAAGALPLQVILAFPFRMNGNLQPHHARLDLAAEINGVLLRLVGLEEVPNFRSPRLLALADALAARPP